MDWIVKRLELQELEVYGWKGTCEIERREERDDLTMQELDNLTMQGLDCKDWMV